MKNRLIGILLSFALVLTMMPALGLAAPSYADTTTGVKYLDANGVEQTCESATVVESTTTAMTGGWYVVNANVAVEDVVSLTGAVHLILCDGAELTLQKGVKEDTQSGVDNNLSIYAQSVGSDMGRLTAGSAGDNTNILVDNITINGGFVSAGGRDYGIFANNGVTINGGNVTASGEAHGIYGTNFVTIKGGTVTASGTGESGVGIGSRHDAGGEGSINIDGGNVTAIGNSIAIYRKVCNAIDGTGWTNIEGGGEGSSIAQSATGKDLSNYKKVTFPAVYPLWVGDKQVTSVNKDDVLGNADEGATVKYDPSTYTLTLNEAAITGRGDYGDPQNPYSANIHSEGIDLNVVLEGKNKVDSGTGPKASAQSADYAIDVNADRGQGGKLTINGAGELAVNGYKDAICTDGDCEIKNVKISATSDDEEAISGYKGVEISGSEVSAESADDDAIYAAGDIKIDNSKVKATADDQAILANGDGNLIIDSSEVEAIAGNGDRAIDVTNCSVNKSKLTLNKSKASEMAGPAIHAYGNIDITDSIIDDSKGQIYATDKLTIRNSKVTTEAVYGALYGVEEFNIEYTEGGKYSTRVEATATGGEVTGTSTNYDWPDIALLSNNKGCLKVGSNLAVIEPKGGRVDNYKLPNDEVIATVMDGNKCASHVVIEVVKPAPAPAANVPAVTTTAKTSTRSTTIKWTWNAVDGAKKYKVAYHKVGSKEWKVKTTKKTKYVLKGQKIKGLYEYKVAAVTASGDVWSDTSCRYFKTVKAKAKFSKGALKVSWKKDKGAAGYEIFIARNKKMDGAQVIQVAPTSKSYSVTGLEKGKYYVKVRPMKNYNGVTYTGILCKARKVRVK